MQRQTYERWELLVVDDGSDDGTAEYLKHLDDPRIRPFHLDRVGVSNARNNALDNAHGDVVVYLDDDNRFDPDWCKAVAWCFATHPDVDVCYGARVFDDNGRAHFESDSGLPGLQFLPWDRAAVEEFNRVDMNVLAHRRGVANARFESDVRLLRGLGSGDETHRREGSVRAAGDRDLLRHRRARTA